MVISELIREAAEQIGMRDAQLLFMSALGMDALSLFMNGKTEPESCDVRRITEMVERAKAGEPIQYITGVQEFMGLEFSVNPDVLIPRSDTEVLVEYIIENVQGAPAVLDIGTGSGCIGISIAHFIKEAQVTCLDISDGALKTAKKNAADNGVRIEFVQADILKEIPTGSFDIIVSNPPYIETDVVSGLDVNVREFEPHTALDGGADGLIFYRRITNIAPQILKKDGLLCYEIGYNQGDAVSTLMKERFYDVRVIKDLCGNDRVVSGRFFG